MNLPLPLPMLSTLGINGFAQPRPLLTDRQRQRLASIATRLQLPAKAIIYRDGDAAESIFINGGGVVISFKEMPSGKRRVAGFRFHGDLFGLAEHGRYVNTTRAVTPVTIYQISVETLTAFLRQDAELEFQFLCKIVARVAADAAQVDHRGAARRGRARRDVRRHAAQHGDPRPAPPRGRRPADDAYRDR